LHQSEAAKRRFKCRIVFVLKSYHKSHIDRFDNIVVTFGRRVGQRPLMPDMVIPV
jgi:hypothetical protein